MPSKVGFKWRSSQAYEVTRYQFAMTHAMIRTSTAAQGQTLKGGVVIDCAKHDDGIDDDTWWLHLYVMLSRATQMQDMLLVRPPPAKVLFGGPPKELSAQLATLARRTAACRSDARRLAAELGFPLPA